MFNYLNGNIKTFLGLCCSKGCRNKGDYKVTINIGDKKIKRMMCSNHAEQFLTKHPEYLKEIEFTEL